MIDKRIKDYFERKPNVSYLFFACMIFLFRVLDVYKRQGQPDWLKTNHPTKLEANAGN